MFLFSFSLIKYKIHNNVKNIIVCLLAFRKAYKDKHKFPMTSSCMSKTFQIYFDLKSEVL